MKVRDVIPMVEHDGCYEGVTKRSGRRHEHPMKPGRVAIDGHPGDDMPRGDARVQQASGRADARKGIMKRRVLVRIDKDADSDWSASVPNLPGRVATGKTVDPALRRIESADSRPPRCPPRRTTASAARASPSPPCGGGLCRGKRGRVNVPKWTMRPILRLDSCPSGREGGATPRLPVRARLQPQPRRRRGWS